MKIIILFLILLSFQFSAQAQEKCLSGDLNQGHLIKQFKIAQNTEKSVTKFIFEKYNLGQKTEAGVNCTDCESKNKNQEDLKNVTNEKTQFKLACLEAAAKIQTGSKQISCPDQKKAHYGFCFTSPMAEYQNVVISEFYKCVKSVNPDMPITLTGLFDIYTNESGFKPAYSNAGGNGLGQLTSIFIDDLHQKHRGYPFLKSINESTDPTCTSAKIIISKDFQKKPTLENICQYTQYGEGFERNILYSMTGLASAWKKDYEPLMKQYNRKYADKPLLLQKVQEKVVLNGYGSGGRAAGRAAFNRLAHLAPDNFIKQIDQPLMTLNSNLTAYAVKTKKKQKTLNELLQEPLKSEFMTKGSSVCLE